MQFREWLQFNEMTSHTLPKPIGRIAYLDMRFEDWDDEKSRGIKRWLMASQGQGLAWFGVTPDKQHYLYWDGEHLTDAPSGQPDQTNRPKSVPNSKKPEMPELPDEAIDIAKYQPDWWDYTAGYSADGDLVKVPKETRDADKQNIIKSRDNNVDMEYPGKKVSRAA